MTNHTDCNGKIERLERWALAWKRIASIYRTDYINIAESHHSQAVRLMELADINDRLRTELTEARRDLDLLADGFVYLIETNDGAAYFVDDNRGHFNEAIATARRVKTNGGANGK